MTTYKLVDVKDGKPHTLFYGVNGTRQIPMDKWLIAKQKPVIDGSGGTTYISGFHVLKSLKETVKYLDNFTDTENKAIAVCEVEKLRPKKHSRSNVYLADKIYITKILKLNQVLRVLDVAK